MKTLAKDVYSVIRHRLAVGELPPGVRVSEFALSKEFGISRAPIREAIGRLSSEGLLDRVPNVGAFVKKPSRDDLQDLYELRMWLEGEAAAKAATVASDELLDEIERCCQQLREALEAYQSVGEPAMLGEQQERFVTADLSFHLALVKASGNRRALELLANQHLLSRPWAQLGKPSDLAKCDKTYREHEEILRAVRLGDAELARQRVRHHIGDGLRLVLENLDRLDSVQLTSHAVGAFPQGLQESLRRLEEAQKANKHRSDRVEES